MHTLISVFDDKPTARRAIERLVEVGFARSDLHLQEPDSTDGSSDDVQERALGEMAMRSPEREVAVDPGVLEALGNFFARFMGTEQQRHATVYSEAVHRGCCVVVVDVKDGQDTEVAAAMLHELGAVDVNERSKQWGGNGWTSDADADGRNNTRPGVRTYAREDKTPLREIVSQRRNMDRPAVTRYANPERAPETLEDRAGRVATERAVAFEDAAGDKPNR